MIFSAQQGAPAVTTRHRHPVPATVFEISGVIVPLQVQLDPVVATIHNTALFDKDDYVLFND